MASFHNGSARIGATRIDGIMADPRLATAAMEIRAVEGVGLPGHTPFAPTMRVTPAQQEVWKKKTMKQVIPLLGREEREKLLAPVLQGCL